MAVDFPGSPTNGQVFSVGGASWRYNGYAWARIPDPGEKGQKGQKGEVGEKGQKGQQGDKGVQGNFGGATFDYTFSDATGTPTDLNTGRLRLNNSTVSSATTIFIDDEDDNGTDIQPFLRTIDDSTSTIKGHVRISNKLNADDFALFTISSATEQSGFHQINVGYVSGSASSFTNGEDIIVTFARTGDQGQKGEQGIQGVKGVQDKIFEGDTEAEVVDTGGNGHFKVTTEGTERFKIDNVGLATFTNDVVISNTLFFNKTTLQICKIDHDGANLDLHADGNVNFFESDGNTLMFTFDVNTTNGDARLIMENDTDTFFNHPDNNQLGFTVGGTDTIRITPGKVGIGIINPGSPLQIVDSSDASIRIFDNTGVTGDLSSSGWKFRALAGNATINASGLQISHGTNERINITTDGKVGINSTTPGTKLEVVGNIRAFSDPDGFAQITSSGSIELKRSGGSFIDFATAGTEDHDCRIKQDSNGLIFVTGGQGSTTEKFRFGSSGQLGLAGTNYGLAGQVLTSQGASSSPQWVTPTANTNTTYDLITSSSGANVQLLLDASVGDDDPILITAGSNVSFAGISATGFTINTVDTNTTYDLGTADGDNTSEEKIQLNGSDSTTDSVILAVGTGLSIQRDSSTNKITITNTAPDTNTTYDLLAVQTGGNDDDPAIRLDPSSGSNDDIQIVGGTNVTVTRNSSNKITISSTDTNTDTNTTYSISCVNGVNSDEERIRLTGTNPSSTDDITLEAGTGLSISRSGDKITFTNTDTGSGTGDTTYSISCVNGVNTDEERIRLTDSNGTTDDVTLEAGTGLSIARSGDKITFTNTDTGSGANTDNYANSLSFSSGTLTLGRTGSLNDLTTTIPLSGITGDFTDLDDTPSDYTGDANKLVAVNNGNGTNGTGLTFVNASSVGTDTNTTYSLSCVNGVNSDEERIRLTAGGSGSGTDDITLEAGTGLSISRSGDKITFTNSDTGSGANTTYDLSVPSGTTKIRLDPSDASGNDDVEIAGGSNVTVTRNNGNKLTISSTNTNTTYTAGGNYGMTLSGTEFRLKDDRRRNSNTVDVRSGNTHDYTFYDASHGIRWYTSGSEEMRLENDGDLHVDGDIIAYSTTISDIRLKKDLQIIQSPLDILSNINGYTFTYKKDDKKSAGVVAQEVEKVFPQAVSEKGLPFSSKDEENPDNYKTVEYDQIVGLLVQAVKELTDKVKKLEGES